MINCRKEYWKLSMRGLWPHVRRKTLLYMMTGSVLLMALLLGKLVICYILRENFTNMYL